MREKFQFDLIKLFIFTFGNVAFLLIFPPFSLPDLTKNFPPSWCGHYSFSEGFPFFVFKIKKIQQLADAIQI